MSHLPIWYLGKLESNECDQVVAELSKLNAQDAAMGVDGAVINHATRNTKICFAANDYWLVKDLSIVGVQANLTCQWGYEITGNEQIQFAEYGPEQHYGWHTDFFPLSGKPTDRKISVVCLLNDDFEGGEFEMRLYSDYQVPLEKGTIVAFPSILEHRVKPVTSGKRYSATMWFNGPRFR